MAVYRRTLRVWYPAGDGEIVLRTAANWSRDVRTATRSSGGERWDFEVTTDAPMLEYKPCRVLGGSFRWASGANKLLVATGADVQDVYPYFEGGPRGRVAGPFSLASERLGRPLRMWVYLPPGYDENSLKRYPVLWMHDGRNLFFPEQSFLGTEWEADETLDTLDEMNLIDQVLVVAIDTTSRNDDYTAPGYAAYRDALVDEVLPRLRESFRVLGGPENTAVLGSSLGGVVSFFLAWDRPDVFGFGGCLSSTFGWRDDLLQRVEAEGRAGREALRLYLDCGWPRDNYDRTVGMANAVLRRGFRGGVDVVLSVFPGARHDEASWGARLHLPIQFFFGKFARLSRTLST